MRRSVTIIIYAVALLLCPLFEIAVIAPLITHPWVVIFPLVITIGFFILPPRWWWGISLLGALWHDSVQFAPWGLTLLATLVLGACLTMAVAQFSSHSLGTDFLVIISAVAVTVMVMTAELMVSAHLAGRSIELPDVFGEVILVLIVAALEAVWLRRRAHRHQYVR